MEQRDPRFDVEKRKRVRALYESGLSERAVAEKVGLPRTRLRELLAEAGTRKRPVGRPARKRAAE